MFEHASSTRRKNPAIVIAVLALASVLLPAQTPAPPPDLTGTWSGPTQMSRGKDLFTLVLARTGDSYSGTLTDAMGLLNGVPIEDARYSDGTLRFSFKASLPNRDLHLEATLTLEHGRLIGVWTAESGDTASLDLERRGSAAPAAALPVATPARGDTEPEFADAIAQAERTVAAEWGKDKLGSVTVGLVSGSRLIWAKSFGLADIEQGIPATPDTIYRIGSITKQFTGLMLLQLVEAGKVHLSESVQAYFPEINAVQGRQPWYPTPTFIQLATHTSGLDREPAGPPSQFMTGPVSEWENALIAALPQVKYVSEPDTRYMYANVGYAILGAALGRAAREPYVDYVREHILVPLGMTDTAFELDAEMRARLAKGYDVDAGRVDSRRSTRELAGRGYKVPNGGLFTTVGDMARFVSFELGEGPDTVLTRTAWTANLTRTNSSMLDLTTGYGIGFMVNRRGPMVIYGHAGDVAGYSAAAQFDRASRTGVVVLSNIAGSQLRVGPLADRLLDIVAAAAR